MRILYLDTSSSFLYTGIVEDDELKIQIKQEFGQHLSEEALPQVADLFKKANINSSSIDKIIVVDGPGSFTGIRVGLTIAKVYAWALNIDITTITSLEAMATSIDTNLLKVPMIDARREYVYAAVYDGDKEVLKPQHIKIDDLKEKIIGEYITITNDSVRLDKENYDYSPDILKIVKKYKNKNAINAHLVNPNYLKLTEAEESKS